MFDTVLIANRGEIACRIAASCKRMGIRTVMVYSTADRHALHVKAGDDAIWVGEAEPQKSYLNIPAIIAAAKRTGAQAIHPGYGFLAENAGFAKACADNGITFIGPSAESITAMGDKSSAKQIMEKAEVPLVPGYHGHNQEPDFLHQQANDMGYPVLIKASAGGGGKGMRIVEDSAHFLESLSSCQREAKSSFSNDHVLIERYLQKPRHIEIQVFADTLGNTIHLFERDCSVQRRHQKVIEEAPAPGLTQAQRDAMGAAAVAAAQAVNYVGAGTVEFICEGDDFYFMEMNTRLQVEHPITEQITGFDLVEWQLRVAAGQALPAKQDELKIHGHAFEARIYAENPDNQFLPSIGQIKQLIFPTHQSFALSDVRVDSGIRQGDSISPFYDPMIAKLIVHGVDREDALRKMQSALEQSYISGLHTNLRFLHRLACDEAFMAGDVDTGFIERRHDSLFPKGKTLTALDLAVALATRLHHLGINDSQHSQPAVDPWDQKDYWRANSFLDRSFTFTQAQDELEHTVHLTHKDKKWQLQYLDNDFHFEWHCSRQTEGNLKVSVSLDDQLLHTIVYDSNDTTDIEIRYPHTQHILSYVDPLTSASLTDEENAGDLTAPMPGKVLSVAVSKGDVVKSGQLLLVLEAMKMEHSITAPHAGTVVELFFTAGEQVTEGAALLAIETEPN